MALTRVLHFGGWQAEIININFLRLCIHIVSESSMIACQVVVDASIAKLLWLIARTGYLRPPIDQADG